MGGFGSYYTGEKKKKKKGEQYKNISFSPTFVPPQILGKGKKE